MTRSFVTWGAIFTTETNVTRRTRTLFYFKGQSFLSISVHSNFPRNITKAGGNLIGNVSSSDEVSIEISENHHQVFSASWASIFFLVVLFISFDSDMDRSVRLEGSILVLLLVNKSDSITL